MPPVVQISPALDKEFRNFTESLNEDEAARILADLKERHHDPDSLREVDLLGTFLELFRSGKITEDDLGILKITADKSQNLIKILSSLDIFQRSLPSRNEAFVGRSTEKQEFVKLLSDQNIHGINLHGISGVGKTTIAKKIANEFAKDSWKELTFDLREVKDIETAYLYILYQLGMSVYNRTEVNEMRDENCLLKVERNQILDCLRKRCLKSKMFLLFDNVEAEIIEDHKDEFNRFLNALTESELCKTGMLKIILTSLSEIPVSSIRNHCVKPLPISSSKEFICRRSKLVFCGEEFTMVDEDAALSRIAEHCQNIPFFLEGAEQMLRNGFLTPVQLLQQIDTQIEMGVPDTYLISGALFQSIPTENLKKLAIKVCVFPKYFSASETNKIAELKSDYDGQLDLEYLTNHRVITKVVTDEGKTEYEVHSLFKEFAASYLKVKFTEYQEAYSRAEMMFGQHFVEKLLSLADKLDKDFAGISQEIQKEKFNFEVVLQLALRREEILGKLLQSHERICHVTILLESLKSIKERKALFKTWADALEQKGDLLASTYIRCWESIQVADIEGTVPSEMILHRAELCLKYHKASLNPGWQWFIAVEGLLLYCQGELNYMQSVYSDRDQYLKSLFLKKAYHYYKYALEFQRDHIITVKILNGIGNCYMELGRPEDAKRLYMDALGMKLTLTCESKKHIEFPTFYNQLSQAYQKLGDNCKEKEMQKDYYEEAVSHLKEAIKLNEDLGLDDTLSTATFNKNLANSLIVLERYDEALVCAKKCYELRNKLLGDHPETVRILYLIGMINQSKEDVHTALLNYENALQMVKLLPIENQSRMVGEICDRLEALGKKCNDKEKLQKYKLRIKELQDKRFQRHIQQQLDVCVEKLHDCQYQLKKQFLELQLPQQEQHQQEQTLSLKEIGKSYDFSSASHDVTLQFPEGVVDKSTKGSLRRYHEQQQLKVEKLKYQLEKQFLELQLLQQEQHQQEQTLSLKKIGKSYDFSSASHDVTLQFPEGAVDKSTRGSLRRYHEQQQLKVEKLKYLLEKQFLELQLPQLQLPQQEQHQQEQILSLNEIGGSYDFSSAGLHLLVLPDAVNEKTNLTVKQFSEDTCTLPYPARELDGVVSSIIQFEPANLVFEKPVVATLLHNGPTRTAHYETVAMVFNESTYTWEKVEEIKETSPSNNSTLSFVQVQLTKLTALTVVTRLITDTFEVPVSGWLVRSSVCHDVTLQFPAGAVYKSTKGSLRVLPMPDVMPMDIPNVHFSPIVVVDGFEQTAFHEHVLLTLPNPAISPAGHERVVGQVYVLCREGIEWKDITETVEYVEGTSTIELRVKHFSMIWVCVGIGVAIMPAVLCLYDRLKSGPIHVNYLACAFEERVLKILLVMTSDVRQLEGHITKEEKYTVVARCTGHVDMYPNAKAYIKGEGGYICEEDKILTLNKDSPCIEELNFRRKEVCDDGSEDELIITFYPTEDKTGKHIGKLTVYEIQLGLPSRLVITQQQPEQQQHHQREQLQHEQKRLQQQHHEQHQQQGQQHVEQQQQQDLLEQHLQQVQQQEQQHVEHQDEHQQEQEMLEEHEQEGQQQEQQHVEQQDEHQQEQELLELQQQQQPQQDEVQHLLQQIGKLTVYKSQLGLASRTEDSERETQGLDTDAFVLKNGVIITIEIIRYTTADNKQRKGSEKDVDALVNTFCKTFNFQLKQIRDKTREEILADLEEIVREAAEYDCCAVCVMSHGELGCVADTESKKIKEQQITSIVRDSANFRGKPKIFFFEACRIYPPSMDAAGSSTESTIVSNVGNAQRIPGSLTPSGLRETLIAYACSEGQKATRHRKDGSYFIQNLCKVFQENYTNMDISRMLTKVNNDVMQTGKPQVCNYSSSLSKPIYFKPK